MLRTGGAAGHGLVERRLVATSVVLLLAVACSSSSGGGGANRVTLASTQVLKFPIASDITSLDPATLDLESDSEIAHNIFDGLVGYDSNLNLVPDIAAEMPTVSPDGLTYTFKLRHDVTFSNGDTMTSRDVLYSWNRAVALQGPYSVNLSAIAGYDKVAQNTTTGPALEALLEKRDPSISMAGLTAPDDYTVVARLAAAAGWFVPAIAQPSVAGMIVDQNAIKTDLASWWSKPETLVGTGPFKMTAYTPNQSIDFAAVKSWWGSPQPTLTEVHLEIAPDRAAAMKKYEQGGYDVFGYDGYSPGVADVRRIQSDAVERSQLVLQPTSSSYWVSFNLTADATRPAKGPFTMDQGAAAHDLRLAFALAIDKSKLAQQVCQNILCDVATGGLIPKGMLGYLGDNTDPLAAFDPARARQLLDGADPDRTRTKGIVYVYDSENPLNQPTAYFLQAQWLANLGVSVTLQAAPHSVFISDRLNGHFVLARDGWSADYDDPQDWFDNLWGKAAGCPDSACTSGYDAAAYDTLLAKADAEPLSLAVDDYRALCRQLIGDAAYIPLYHAVTALLIRPNVRGAGANNFFDFHWNQVQITAS